MKIVLGTYEGNLISWESDYAVDPSGRSLRLVYAFHSHEGSVRALAYDHADGNLLVTGGADEHINIYDLKRHREVGTLIEHKDAVACARWFAGTHMISGGRDGLVCVWRSADWVCLDAIKAHKAPVHDVSVHPSGRLAVSIGGDNVLQVLDLTKGKSAHRVKLPGATPPMQAHFTPCGNAYVLVYEGGSATVHDSRTGALARTLAPPPAGREKFCDAVVFPAPDASASSSSSSSSSAAGAVGSGSLLAVGCESGALLAWDVGTGKLVINMPAAHAKRLRCVAFAEEPVGGAAAASASSSSSSSSRSGGPSSDGGGVDPHVSALTKLGAETKRVVKLATPGPYIVTADSEATIRVWDLKVCLASASASAGSGSGAAGGAAASDAATPGLLETLTAATGSRATRLAATCGLAPVAASAAAAAPAPAAAATGGAAAVASHASGGKPSVAGVKRPRPAAAPAVAEAAADGDSDDDAAAAAGGKASAKRKARVTGSGTGKKRVSFSSADEAASAARAAASAADEVEAAGAAAAGSSPVVSSRTAAAGRTPAAKRHKRTPDDAADAAAAAEAGSGSGSGSGRAPGSAAKASLKVATGKKKSVRFG